MDKRTVMTEPNRKARQFLQGESGAAWLEWVVVAVILILAAYALFQAIGVEFSPFENAFQRLNLFQNVANRQLTPL